MNLYGVPLGTVVFSGDFRLLLLQAMSIDRNFDHSCMPEYTIVVNDSKSKELREGLIEALSKSISSALFAKTQILLSEELGITSRLPGWISQQGVKLSLADYYRQEFGKGTDGYVVLDSKNHFISRVSGEVFFKNGRPLAEWISPGRFFAQNLKASFETVEAEFPPISNGNMLRPVTPQFLYLDVVENLNSILRMKFGDDLAVAIQESNGTEFLLYFAMLSKLELLGRYAFDGIPGVTLFTTWPEDEKLLTRLVLEAKLGNTPIFGLHKNRIEKLSLAQRTDIEQLWTSKILLPWEDPKWFLAQE